MASSTNREGGRRRASSPRPPAARRRGDEKTRRRGEEEKKRRREEEKRTRRRRDAPRRRGGSGGRGGRASLSRAVGGDGARHRVGRSPHAPPLTVVAAHTTAAARLGAGWWCLCVCAGARAAKRARREPLALRIGLAHARNRAHPPHRTRSLARSLSRKAEPACPGPSTVRANDWMHCESVAAGPYDNLIVGCRHVSTILSVSKDGLEEVYWTLSSEVGAICIHTYI